MQTYEVRTKAQTELIYESSIDGRTVIQDAGSGEKRGQTPLELLLSAVAGCATVDVFEILKKRRKQVDNVEVITTGDRRDEPYPRIFTKIHLHFRVTSPDAGQTEVDKAVHLSLEKYCSVRGCLSSEIQVTADAEIIRPGS